MKIKVVDSVMGSGKTMAMINKMNESPEEGRFLFITPYLEEIPRIIEGCPRRRFIEPEERYNKTVDLVRLLKEGRNIVTTHALFKLLPREAFKIIKSKGYTLVMDEIVSVVEPMWTLTNSDYEILMSNSHVEDGMIIWDNSEYTGVFEELKRLSELESLHIKGNQLIWMMPVYIFKCFKEAYILTYMYRAQPQKYYYDYRGVETEYYHATQVNGEFVIRPGLCKEKKYNYREKIKICVKPKLNKVGDKKTALSKSWYNRYPIEDTKQLKKNMHNFVQNICNSKSSDVIWTCFKSCKNRLTNRGYVKGFISSTMRATNKYRDRTCVIYPINVYFNPFLKNFFIDRGIDVYEDEYALSEMLQFIWRSAIRDGREINVYVPSKRMRNLLLNWIKDNSLEE